MPPLHPLYAAWVAEDAADGERRPRAPLHLTLVPPFAGDEQAALAALRAVAANAAPVAAQVAEAAQLGPRRDVPVLLIAPVEGLRGLHAALMDSLEARGVDLGHARHVREGFRPHVTVRRRAPESVPLAPGDPVEVDHVALLRRGGGWTEVVARAPLAG